MAKKNEQGVVDTNEVINASEAFFQKYGKTTVIALVALIVIIVGIYAYQNYVAGPRADKASTELAVGQEFFGAGQYAVALNGDSAT